MYRPPHVSPELLLLKDQYRQQHGLARGHEGLSSTTSHDTDGSGTSSGEPVNTASRGRALTHVADGLRVWVTRCFHTSGRHLRH
jgi:hypothetical protein